jgi:hypothetical protein
MTTKEALADLSKDGIELTIWELRGSFDRGLQRPRLNSSLQFDWTPEDLKRVRQAVAERQTVGAAT